MPAEKHGFLCSFASRASAEERPIAKDSLVKFVNEDHGGIWKVGLDNHRCRRRSRASGIWEAIGCGNVCAWVRHDRTENTPKVSSGRYINTRSLIFIVLIRMPKGCVPSPSPPGRLLQTSAVHPCLLLSCPFSSIT